MPVLLHISDLHRTSAPRVSNDDLLAAIASDSGRWEADGIAPPDLIVVSGDIVQGVDLDEPDPDTEIAAQYAEAEDFLSRLAEHFVDSDRARVIIVPGNHDVNWPRARAAMAPTGACPTGIAKWAYEAESNIRWSWDEQMAYEIADGDLYDSRCEHFRAFRAAFYAGLDPNPLHYGDDIAFFDYPALGLVVVGLASWYGNDCYCDVGEIESRLVSLSRELISASSAPVAIAAWHHSIHGEPLARDYMDERVIHRLIDFGFSVGLHGHQHYPGAAPFELRLPNRTAMAIVGAGSLAVGNRELPMGERRQFNLVAVDPDNERITVHVRAMSPAGVFTGSHRDDFGGETFISLPLASAPSRPTPPSMVTRIDDAMNAIRRGEYQMALDIVADASPSQALMIRQVQVEALAGLGRYEELLALTETPQTPDEVVRTTSLLLDEHRFDEATKRLEAGSALLDAATRRDLAAAITARRMPT